MACVMTITDKGRENRARRIAERRGYRLEKSRRRDPRATDYGRYQLIDAVTEYRCLARRTVAHAL